MLGYLQLQFDSSQDEDDLIGSENYWSPQGNFQEVLLDLMFNTLLHLQGIWRKSLKEEESDVEIVKRPIETTRKKRGPIAKKKAPAKKRATKVKVEGEEGEEKMKENERRRKIGWTTKLSNWFLCVGRCIQNLRSTQKKQCTLLNFFAIFFVRS